MPWKVQPVSDIRFALCHAVRSAGLSVSHAAREFGVSRKTAHKWLKPFDASPHPRAADLADRSRKPRRSPARTCDAVEAAALLLRDRYNWGPRKIHFHLAARALPTPSVRTLAAVLTRHGRVRPPTPPPPPAQRFERPRPNQLWQLDFKGAVEVDRKKLMPLSILDDHSRYLLAFKPCPDVTMNTAWAVLWDVFAAAGLPDQILCDNAFAAMGTQRPAGISRFESRLARLGIGVSHGRPYHPQTQGKVERMHRSSVRELFDFNARRDNPLDFAADCESWRDTYNALRPHQAIGDLPPAARWRPSQTPRPRLLPEPDYPRGATLRTVCDAGKISVRSYRILCGRGIAGEKVRVEERDHEIAVFYCSKEIRSVSHDRLDRGIVL
jgi:transposase InsO family protein